MRVGIVAVQGGVTPHRRALLALGHEAVDVRTRSELATVDGLVLPGGESTTQRLLMETDGLGALLRRRAEEGVPVLGTCAGLIVAVHLGLIDIEVTRNGWGPQVESCETQSDGRDPLPVILIRAPRIGRTGRGVSVVAQYRGEPVWVQNGAVHGTTFHPELADDPRVHRAVFG